MVGHAADEPVAEGADDPQIATLRLFLALRLHRPAWAGALLLGLGLDGPGTALARATLAAGAAGLFLENDPAVLRTARREGSCTFTVTTLPEAIRILKNEVRQRRAVTVALSQQPDAALAEMLERGLQPQAMACSRPAALRERDRITDLHSRGAEILHGFGLVPTGGAIDLQPEFLSAMRGHWHIHTDLAATLQERRSRDLDLLAAAVSNPNEQMSALAAEWLRVAPAFFPRALRRVTLLRVDSQ